MKREFEPAAGAVALAFLPHPADGWRLAAAGRDDGTVRVFDPAGRETATLAGHSEPILSLAASPNGSLLASGGREDGVCVWDAAAGTLKASLPGPPAAAVRGLVFAAEGVLVTACEDGAARAPGTRPPAPTAGGGGLPAAVTALAFPPGATASPRRARTGRSCSAAAARRTCGYSAPPRAGRRPRSSATTRTAAS